MQQRLKMFLTEEMKLQKSYKITWESEILRHFTVKLEEDKKCREFSQHFIFYKVF